METWTVTLVCLLAVSGALCKSCEDSTDCGDVEGRSLCYEKTCRRDIPCNKDNDCFFYGAADVSVGRPHPKCFKNEKANSPPGYGVCMLQEYAGGLERIPGGDVIERSVEREVENLKNIFKIIKKAGMQ